MIPSLHLFSELCTEGFSLQKVSIDEAQKEILGQEQRDRGQLALESFLFRSLEKNIPLNLCLNCPKFIGQQKGPFPGI